MRAPRITAVSTSHEQRAQRERRITQLRKEIAKAQAALATGTPAEKVGADLAIARASAELARLGVPQGES